MRSIAKVTALLLTAVFLVIAASATAAPRRVVLGSASFAGPNGQGWGAARPRELFNGGDPSGPGGPLGRWFPWSGARSLCHSGFGG